MSEWSLRTILNPVITRLLIYGINPIDLEYVISNVEIVKLLNSKQLEKEWRNQWERKADHFLGLANEADKHKHFCTAQEMYYLAAQCYYACFLINFSDIEIKKDIYLKYCDTFSRSVSYCKSISKVKLSIDETNVLAGYSYFPDKETEPIGGIVFYSGLGSCKEEMHQIATEFMKRGFAVLVPDMPGNGESLIRNNVKCRMSSIKKAFRCAADYLQSRVKNNIGVGGLCMGGGYAFKAAAIEKRYSFCVNLFPLFITETPEGVTPQWMSSGPWYNYQTGGIPANDFLGEMGLENDDYFDCPYLVVHGQHDNWMKLNKVQNLFDRIKTEDKKMIVIDDKPVFSNEESVTHTMPVGEQMHWVKHIIADWARDIVTRG